MLTDLDLSPPPGYDLSLPPHHLSSPVTGSLTITGLDVHGPSGWRPAGAGLLSAAGRWRPGHSDDPPDRLAATATGLSWQFSSRPNQDALLLSVNRPYPLPAVVSAAMLSPGQHLVSAPGLGGSPVDLRVAAAARVVPSAAQSGVIVDRQYAELAADENFPQAQQQVWLAAGALPVIGPRLAAAGLRVQSVRNAADVATSLARQALASVLFLADAAAAGLLAASAAVLGLYLSARRRRYEYAALSASGIPRAVLRRAVLIELALVLGFGAVIGVAAGLAAAFLALRSVPEFVTTPAALPLSYVPSAGPVLTLLAATAGLLVIAVTASVALIRGVSLDQLRETPT